LSLRAVIFDYGKVISLPADAADHAEMVRLSGLESLLFDNYYWKFRDEYDGGFLTCAEYFRKIVATAGAAPLPDQTITAMVEADCRMWTHLNPPMLEWVASVRQAGYKLGILSNLGEALVRYMTAQFPWLDQFDSLMWSSEHKLFKPQPEIYRITLNRLDVEPNEAIFIDDKPENILAAEACGMEGLVFTTYEALPSQLTGHELLATLPNTLR